MNAVTASYMYYHLVFEWVQGTLINVSHKLAEYNTDNLDNCVTTTSEVCCFLIQL